MANIMNLIQQRPLVLFNDDQSYHVSSKIKEVLKNADSVEKLE